MPLRSSWPDLIRPSTRFRRKDNGNNWMDGRRVDARVKHGHDGKGTAGMATPIFSEPRRNSACYSLAHGQTDPIGVWRYRQWKHEMMRKHFPPPTRYGPTTAQAKPAPGGGAAIPPPPTRFGPASPPAARPRSGRALQPMTSVKLYDVTGANLREIEAAYPHLSFSFSPPPLLEQEPPKRVGILTAPYRSQLTIAQRIEALARDYPYSETWYAWGKKEYMVAWSTEGDIYRRAHEVNQSAQGSGLYLASRFWRSYTYCPPDGYLLIATFSGTPHLNETNKTHVKRLKDELGLDFKDLYKSENSAHFFMIYGSGNYGRLTTNENVSLSVDLRNIPAPHRSDVSKIGAGDAKAVLQQQALDCGMDPLK